MKWLRDERGFAPLLTAVGLLLTMGAVAGGSAVYQVAATQATLRRAAQAVVEGEKQNGCYDAGTEQTVQGLIAQAGLDPARVALSADTQKQAYGAQVSSRVEYVVPVRLVGVSTPYQVRVAADAKDVSAHVAPVRNAPCKAPAFAQATGRSGFEDGGSAQPAAGGPALAQNPGGSTTPAPSDNTRAPAVDPNCKRPVTLTRTVTKYREEPYQVQVGTRQETRYREETYQEPVQKTRTVTRYREEPYQVQVGTRQETRYREETRYRTETYTVPVQKTRTVTRYRTETYQEPRTGYRSESYTVSVPHQVSYSYRVPHTGTSCSGWGRWRSCRSYTYYTTSYVNYTYYTSETRTRSVPYTYYVTLSRQVPYQATETYTVNETRTRQVAYTARVPYTVAVPVMETRSKRVPYQAQETYVVMETKTRQVPYTVQVPVFETRTKQVPYQATETYTDYVPCGSTPGVLPVSNPSGNLEHMPVIVAPGTRPDKGTGWLKDGAAPEMPIKTAPGRWTYDASRGCWYKPPLPPGTAETMQYVAPPGKVCGSSDSNGQPNSKSPSDVSRGTGQPTLGSGVKIVAAGVGEAMIQPAVVRPDNGAKSGSLLDAVKRLVGHTGDAVVATVGRILR